MIAVNQLPVDLLPILNLPPEHFIQFLIEIAIFYRQGFSQLQIFLILLKVNHVRSVVFFRRFELVEIVVIQAEKRA